MPDQSPPDLPRDSTLIPDGAALLRGGAPLVRDDALRAMLTERLAGFEVRAAASGDLKPATVAVAITDEGHGSGLEGMARHEQWSRHPALVLTRRSKSLRRHAGQWALPGGRIDAGETPEQAALRELQEEVNLPLDESQILGRLDDVITRSGFLITPVVIWAGDARQMSPNPAEVHRIHRMPFSEFLRNDAPMLTPVADSQHPELRMPVGNTWIAAPTASVLYQFREVCILRRHTRVDYFEQPRFAWK